MKNKKKFIIEGEDIFIDRLDINIKDKNKTEEIVKDHLTELFGDIEDLIFYIERLRSKKKRSLILYCIKCENKELIKNISKGKIKILPLQFYIYRKFKNKLKRGNYVMIFKNNDSLYINFIKDKRIFDSSLLKDVCVDTLQKKMVELREFIGEEKNLLFINSKNKIRKTSIKEFCSEEFYSRFSISSI